MDILFFISFHLEMYFNCYKIDIHIEYGMYSQYYLTIDVLTLSQTTNFRLFQTERL